MVSLYNSGQSDAECPPKDVYILRFTNAGDIELRPKYGADPTDPNCEKVQAVPLSFKVCEFDYDEDEHERDWNGFEIKNLFNIGKDFNHAKSKIGALLKALMQVEHIDVGTDIDLEELYGRRIKATVGPNDNGYPRIESPLAYKKRVRRDTHEDIDADTVVRSRRLTEKIVEQSGMKKVEPDYEDDDDGAALFED